MTDFGTALVLVFLAELGDKSMLLALAFATRYRVRPVLAGIVTAAFIATGIATLVGAALGTALPEKAIAMASGALFLAFGAWMLAAHGGGDDEATAQLRGVHGDNRTASVYLGVTVAFLLAELGDKTTLATAVLASTQVALPTWIGAALGMTATSSIAIVVGATVGSRLSRRWAAIVAAAAFMAFGVALLLEGMSR